MHNSPEQQHNNRMNTTIATQRIIKKVKNNVLLKTDNQLLGNELITNKHKLYEFDSRQTSL